MLITILNVMVSTPPFYEEKLPNEVIANNFEHWPNECDVSMVKKFLSLAQAKRGGDISIYTHIYIKPVRDYLTPCK